MCGRSAVVVVGCVRDALVVSTLALEKMMGTRGLLCWFVCFINDKQG